MELGQALVLLCTAQQGEAASQPLTRLLLVATGQLGRCCCLLRGSCRGCSNMRGLILCQLSLDEGRWGQFMLDEGRWGQFRLDEVGSGLRGARAGGWWLGQGKRF